MWYYQLCLGEWKSLSVLIFARYSSFCYLWMAAICKRRREHGDIYLKKGCEKPGALKLIACINFSSKRRIEMWRVIFEYVRLHNPSSTALPIMVCAEINAGHQLDSKKTVRCHAYENIKRIKVGDIKGHNWVPICEYDFSDFFVKLLTVKNTLVAISSKPLFFQKGVESRIACLVSATTAVITL